MSAAEAAAGAGEVWVPGETARRTVTGIVLSIPALASVFLGLKPFAVFIAVMAVVMAWEWVRVTGAKEFGATGGVLAGLLVAAIALAAFERFLAAYAVVVAAVPVTYAVARILARAQALAIAAGGLYIGVPGVSTLWLYARPEIGRDLVIWLVCIVIAADIGAYFVGRALKGPKLAPRISPGKTWSGAFGGIVGAIVVGIALGLFFRLSSVLVLATAALVFAVISQMGDLLESGLKRAFRVKDASGILPGHGGMMDRVDGIVAVLVVATVAIWAAGGDPRLWL
jgi:phosphatidate cytidylyltransferase